MWVLVENGPAKPHYMNTLTASTSFTAPPGETPIWHAAWYPDANRFYFWRGDNPDGTATWDIPGVPQEGANKVGLTLCPGSCGFFITWHQTHCCEMCKWESGKHGQHCNRERCEGDKKAPCIFEASSLKVVEAMSGFIKPAAGWMFRTVFLGHAVPSPGVRAQGAAIWQEDTSESVWVEVYDCDYRLAFFWELVTNTCESVLPAAAKATWKAVSDRRGRYYYVPKGGGTAQWDLPVAPGRPGSRLLEDWDAQKKLRWPTPGCAVTIEGSASERYNGQAGIVAWMSSGYAAIELPYPMGDVMPEVPLECLAPLRAGAVVHLQSRAQPGAVIGELAAKSATDEPSLEVMCNDGFIQCTSSSLVRPSGPLSNLNLQKDKGEQRCKFTSADGLVHEFDLQLPICFRQQMQAAQKRHRFAAPWPLLVYLHGSGGGLGGGSLFSGARKNVNSEGLRYAGSNFVVVSPLCKWTWKHRPATWIVELVQCLRGTSWVDPDRVYLTGCSMGGMGTWEIAESAPHLFAAIAPVASYLHQGRMEQIVETLYSKPALVVSGIDDSTCPLPGNEALWCALIARGCNTLEVCCTYGVDHCSFFEAAYCRSTYLLEWLLRHCGNTCQMAADIASETQVKRFEF